MSAIIAVHRAPRRSNPFHGPEWNRDTATFVQGARYRSIPNRPREPMLEKAVEYLLEELRKRPVEKVEEPEGPDRS